MPDWSYRTLFRPLLFRLPAHRARDLCLGAMGLLARTPLGPAVIDFLGHMRPDPRLRRSFLGIDFPSPVGLGPGIDTQCAALPALARFGFGFLEVGPITARPIAGLPVELDRGREAIRIPAPLANPGVEAAASRLARAGALSAPVLVRLASDPAAGIEQATAERIAVLERLAPHVQAFSVSTFLGSGRQWSVQEWRAHFAAIVEAAARCCSTGGPTRRPVLACLLCGSEPSVLESVAAAAIDAGAEGLLIEGCVADGEHAAVLGPPARELALELTRRIRRRFGSGPLIIAGGGIHEPSHALDFLQAGADLVEIESGLVHGGPGLPKRVNEATLQSMPGASPPDPKAEPSGRSPFRTKWPWTAFLGAGMLAGGLLAAVIAATRVVLPYDEAMSGMTRDALSAINDRLLHFMAHDRLSLAGTMISVGVFYLMLSLYAIRRGSHWAAAAVLTSASAGFFSFFLFLGFGYFDPFHAFVTAVLFQFLLLAIYAPLPALRGPPAAELREDRAWRLSLWGQLLFIVHAAGLLGAGVVISTIGATSVFVPEDLEFMGTTADAIKAANPMLVPLIAHDRASLGGMLIANGLAFLLTSLWGFQRGSAWLWWTLLAAGLPAYGAAVGVHLVVGYTSVRHLLPAFAGFALFGAALVLTHPFLTAGSRSASLESSGPWRAKTQ